MRLSRPLAIALRQFFLIRGSVSRIVPLFVWAAIDIILWGFLTKFLGAVVPPTFNVATTLLGAILLWNFLIRFMQGVTTPFLEDVWTRDFINVFSTPLSITEYLFGLVIASVATSVIGIAVMLLVALLFGFTIAIYGLFFVPFVLVLFLFAIALGIAGTAIVLRLGPSAEWFIWPIPAIISPFVGVLYPLSVLPPWMQTIGRLLPPSYVFETMRSMISGQAVSGTPLLIGTALAILSILLACWLFSAVFRRIIRTGLLARYSAESTG